MAADETRKELEEKMQQDLNYAFREYKAKIENLQMEIDELAKENERLRRSMISSTGIPLANGTTTFPSSSSLKISKPSEFTGGNAKTDLDVDTFLLQCDLYFSLYPSATDIQKNAFVLSYCKGSAARWAEAIIQRNMQGLIPTHEELRKEMRAMWGVANKEEKAARDLDSLKQSTSSVAEYVSAFRQLAAHVSGFSDYDLRRRFRTGLQQRVRDQLAHISPREKDTLEKLIEKSLEIGQNFEELDAEKKSRWIPRTGAPQEKKVSEGGNAMDVDANRQRGGPRPQGQQGGKGFKCYRCGQEGHMARNCTNAASGSGGKPATIKAAKEEEPKEDFDARIARIVAEALAKAKKEGF